MHDSMTLVRSRTAAATRAAILPYGSRPGGGRHAAATRRVVRHAGWLGKTAGVVGPDQGPTPSDLSSRSLLQRRREREREREPGILFFVSHSTPHREQQNDEVSQFF